MISELWLLFLQLCDGLDEDCLVGQLELDQSGHGEFLLMEQSTRFDRDPYPAWAKKQRLQAEWSDLEGGVGMLRALLEIKKKGVTADDR